jgi:hypothetical protein
MANRTNIPGDRKWYQAARISHDGSLNRVAGTSSSYTIIRKQVDRLNRISDVHTYFVIDWLSGERVEPEPASPDVAMMLNPSIGQL